MPSRRASDASSRISYLDDIGIQPIVGLQYQVTDRLRFGLTYRAEFDAELEGDLRFRNLAPGVPLPALPQDLQWFGGMPAGTMKTPTSSPCCSKS